MRKHTITLAFMIAVSISTINYGYSRNYSLTITKAGLGKGTVVTVPQGKTFPPGTKVHLKATPSAKSTFAGWSGALTGLRKTRTIIMNGSKTVTVRFNSFTKGSTCTLRFKVTAGQGQIVMFPVGSTKHSTGRAIYRKGQQVVVMAVPNHGETFVGWSGDLSGTRRRRIITMDGDKTISASFKGSTPTDHYSLTTQVVGGRANAIKLNPPGGVYPEFSYVKVTAAKESNGKVFSHWEGALQGAKRSVNFFMADANRTITAVYVSPSEAGTFRAFGNRDPFGTSAPRKNGEVVVTFDELPTARMCFNLPGMPSFLTVNKDDGHSVAFYNGAVETYEPHVRRGSFEPLQDSVNWYSRFWIEEQSDARIVVRHRSALVSTNDENDLANKVIANVKQPQVVEYGPGDWVDETYIIYPDGVHVEESTIHSYFAPKSKPFGWRRRPPHYIHEFSEMLIDNPGHIGPRASNQDIETIALTLIKMDGSSKSIDYSTYPVEKGPGIPELLKAFSSFDDANMFVVNLKSEYHPFIIGRPNPPGKTRMTTISPYAPEADELPYTFQQWPHGDPGEEGYDAAALGHLINWDHHERTATTLTQITLGGFTRKASPAGDVCRLGRSWLKPPALTETSATPAKVYGYEIKQRAYMVDYAGVTKPGDVKLKFSASKERPMSNAAILINNWGNAIPALTINGTVIPKGPKFRFGHQPLMDIGDGRLWQNVLIVFIKKAATQDVQIQISKK